MFPGAGKRGLQLTLGGLRAQRSIPIVQSQQGREDESGHEFLAATRLAAAGRTARWPRAGRLRATAFGAGRLGRSRERGAAPPTPRV